MLPVITRRDQGDSGFSTSKGLGSLVSHVTFASVDPSLVPSRGITPDRGGRTLGT